MKQIHSEHVPSRVESETPPPYVVRRAGSSGTDAAQRLLGPKFTEAVLYAMEIHGDEFKKGTTVPYVAHLLAVAGTVLDLGGTEAEAIAGLLHDTLENHPDKVTAEELERRFGPEVRDIVEMCTDTPPDYRGGAKPPWKDRKLEYIERIRREPYPRCRVSLADKLDNARRMVQDYRAVGKVFWDRFRAGKSDQLWYYRSLVEAFREAEVPAHLLLELDGLVSEMEQRNAIE